MFEIIRQKFNTQTKFRNLYVFTNKIMIKRKQTRIFTVSSYMFYGSAIAATIFEEIPEETQQNDTREDNAQKNSIQGDDTHTNNIQKDIDKFYHLLQNYDGNNIFDQQCLDNLISRLEENGEINEMINGETPLTTAISATNLKSEDQKIILNKLIEHGARPGHKELFMILFHMGASVLKTSLKENCDNKFYLIPSLNLNIITSASVMYYTIELNLMLFEILLPYCEQDVLNNLHRDLQEIIDKEYKKFLDYKLKINDKFRTVYYKEVAFCNDTIISHKFDLLTKEQQKNIESYCCSSIHNKLSDYHYQQELHKEREKTLERKLMPVKQLLNITQKALNKGKLLGISSHKEKD